MEEWKDIPGYEGFYQASDMGRIKSLERMKIRGGLNPERILKELKTRTGYMRVDLCKNGSVNHKAIHRLVAASFLGISDLEVDHINGNRADNRLINLRYVTTRQNQHYLQERSPSSSKYMGVSKRSVGNKWQAEIYKNGGRRYLGTFKDEIEAAAAYRKALIQTENL